MEFVQDEPSEDAGERELLLEHGPNRAHVKLVAFGGYDQGKPRVRLLLDALRARGALEAEIGIDAWRGIEDKASAGPLAVLMAALRLLFSYPAALFRLARSRRDRAILLPYPGLLDIFLAWPLAKLRGQKIILDAFIPLHDTIVRDRALAREGGLAARALWRLERAALRLADIIVVDTDQHGDFFAREFDLDRSSMQTVLVGAEPLFAQAAAEVDRAALGVPEGLPIVLFYGQLIPLHGIPTILEAVKLTAAEPFHWLIIGSGQDEPVVRAFFDKTPPNATWLPWVDYRLLPSIIRSAAVGLGIFGTSDKAARVIPNKLFQIVHASRAVITRTSPAVDPLTADYCAAIMAVPAGDAAALAHAVGEVVALKRGVSPLPHSALLNLGPAPGVQALLDRLTAP